MQSNPYKCDIILSLGVTRSVICRVKRLYPLNPLRPNSDGSQISHCNIMDLSVSQVMRIENMITQVKLC